jgi:hypothetical protein
MGHTVVLDTAETKQILRCRESNVGRPAQSYRNRGQSLSASNTTPLTEISARNLPGGKWQQARKADNLPAICEPIV